MVGSVLYHKSAIVILRVSWANLDAYEEQLFLEIERHLAGDWKEARIWGNVVAG
jgi:hypothetical protein